MIEVMFEEIKTLIAFVVVMVAMIAPSVVAYKVGLNNGRLQVARHIPEIRRLERLNALAPRIEEND